MVFNYKAYDREGRVFFGVIQAGSREEARYALYQKNLIAEEIFPLEKSFKKGSVKVETIIAFTRLLATALSAHIPLDKALEIILDEFPAGNSVGNSFRQIIITLVNELKSGKSFSEALSLFDSVFKSFYIQMVRTGEKSGKLANALEYIHQYLQKQNDVKKKVQSALLYPGLVLFVAGLVLVFFVTVLIPRFEQTYAQFGRELPFPTLVLVRTSVIIKRYIFLILGSVMGIIFLLWRWIRTERGRKWWENLLLHIPVAGNIIKRHVALLFSKTFSLLLRSGVTLRDSLEISGDIVSYGIFRENIQKAVIALSDGKSFSDTLRDNPFIPPLLLQAAAMGEESGRTGELFSGLSDFYEKELDISIEKLTSMLTPVLILLVGVIVGIIILTLFLPILNLSEVVR